MSAPRCYICKEERTLLTSGFDKTRANGVFSSVAVCERAECRAKVDFIREEERSHA